MVELINSSLKNCKFKNCRLLGIDWSLLSKGIGLELDCEGSDLSFTSFYKINLSNSRFVKCKFNEADFAENNLKNVKFNNSDFLKCRFIDNNLSGADFTDAINYFFDLNNNKCKGARFSYPEVLNLLKIHGVEID
jgi:uncharacterized protein YjbI with pentapeptide repeats